MLIKPVPPKVRRKINRLSLFRSHIGAGARFVKKLNQQILHLQSDNKFEDKILDKNLLDIIGSFGAIACQLLLTPELQNDPTKVDELSAYCYWLGEILVSPKDNVRHLIENKIRLPPAIAAPLLNPNDTEINVARESIALILNLIQFKITLEEINIDINSEFIIAEEDLDHAKRIYELENNAYEVLEDNHELVLEARQEAFEQAELKYKRALNSKILSRRASEALHSGTDLAGVLMSRPSLNLEDFSDLSQLIKGTTHFLIAKNSATLANVLNNLKETSDKNSRQWSYARSAIVGLISSAAMYFSRCALLAMLGPPSLILGMGAVGLTAASLFAKRAYQQPEMPKMTKDSSTALAFQNVLKRPSIG